MAQGLGYLALFFVILSFQKNRRISVLWLMLIGVLLFVVHYCLLHAWTGAFMNVIETGAVYVAYQKEKVAWAKRKYWPYLFITLFIIAGLFISRTLVSCLPIIAQVFGTVAVWQKSPRSIRFIMLVPRPLWFTYNFAVGSQAGMVAEVFILTSVVSGIVRFDILKKPRKNTI
jgi:hypothetical protein